MGKYAKITPLFPPGPETRIDSSKIEGAEPPPNSADTPPVFRLRGNRKHERNEQKQWQTN